MTDTVPVDRLLATVVRAASRAIDRGDWAEGSELARQILEVVPGDPTGVALLATAEARGRVGAVDQGRKFLTVLFSDVVGSTVLSERLDPEDYLAVVTAYREIVRDVVVAHEGHVDQYQGDGVVAYFGFPLAGEDDSVRAVEAGLDIVRAVPEAARSLGVELAARVGVHVGRTVLTSSHLGARDRSSAVGFATNVAARIQALAPSGGVVVSDAVVEAIAPHFELTPIGSRELHGVSDDVDVFAVRAPRTRSTMADERLAAPLVGRDAELARLDAAWRATVDGGDAPRVVVISGDPGMGKSRLVRAAIESASGNVATVAEVNCGRDFRHVGSGAVRRAAEKALGLGTSPSTEEVADALRERGVRLGLGSTTVEAAEAFLGVGGPVAPALAPDRLRGAIVQVLEDWLTAEASVAPYVLIVEDVHWADETTVDMLRFLTRRVPDGLMAVLTVRTGEMPPPLKGLLEHAIELRPLVGDDARALVRAFAGDHVLGSSIVDLIARRGEGVPLFTEHLVNATLAHGADGAESLPATLEGLLQSRLDTCGTGRALAEVAAVIGRVFSVDLVERVLAELGDRAPLRRDQIPGAVRSLVRAGLIEPEPAGDDLRFRHALVRDVAYEMQLRSERPARHRAVARSIMATHGEDASPEALSVHFERAGDYEEAAAASVRAAERAADLAEFDRAFEHLRHADRMIEHLDGIAAQRLELARCMQFGATSAASFGYVGEAEQAYLRALELCDAIAVTSDDGLDVQLAAALGGMWSKEVVAGDLGAAAAITERLERMIAVAPPDLAPEFRRFVLACHGFEHLFAGRTASAVRSLSEASSMAAGPVAVRLGTPHDYVAALDALLAVGLVLTAEDDSADQALARALRRAADLSFPVGPFSEAVVHVYGAYMSRLRGDRVDALTRAQLVAEIGERHGFADHAMLGQILGLAARVMEPDADACQALENVLGIWRMAGGGLAVPVLLTELAAGFLRVGATDRAVVAVEDARVMMEHTGQRGCEPEIHRVGALILAAEGGSDANVAEEFLSAIEIALDAGSLLLALRAARDVANCTAVAADPKLALAVSRAIDAAPLRLADELRAAFEGVLSASE